MKPKMCTIDIGPEFELGFFPHRAGSTREPDENAPSCVNVDATKNRSFLELEDTSMSLWLIISSMS